MNKPRTVEFIVYGEPVGQGRGRATYKNGRTWVYDPAKSRNFKQWVRLCAIQTVKKINDFKPFQNACVVDVCFYRSIPISWNKTKRMQAAEGLIRPTTKPDCGNYEKGFYDALNGVIWVDDSIVTDKHVKKRYTADLARVEIKVTEVQ